MQDDQQREPVSRSTVRPISGPDEEQDGSIALRLPDWDLVPPVEPLRRPPTSPDGTR
ncbi:hypothetical protein [Salininema proteolyticum]|uniref:Uncharacterized protein n=1 Tax=Salininema proteolyticum TaxID=1607685 RepID=A0ABV8TUV4_9ACTN